MPKSTTTTTKGLPAAEAAAEVEIGPPPERRASERQRRVAEVQRKYDFSVIRTLRQKKGWTIEEFAAKCGISYAPISRIETNLVKPNLETLDRMAEGLGISTYALLALAERPQIQLQKSREGKAGGFALRSLDAEGCQVHLCTGRKGASTTDPDAYPKELVTLFVTSGSLEATVNGKAHPVLSGESLSFDALFPHRYLALEDVEFLLVIRSRR